MLLAERFRCFDLKLEHCIVILFCYCGSSSIVEEDIRKLSGLTEKKTDASRQPASTAENLSDRLMMEKMLPKGLFLYNIVALSSGKQEGGNVGLFGQSEQSNCFGVKLSTN